MITIDFLEEIGLTNNLNSSVPIKVMLPRSYNADTFFVLPLEHRDNRGNEDMSEFNRNLVTRVTYVIWANIERLGDIPVVEYDNAAKAEKVYDEVMDAISRGDKLYSFRRSSKQ